MFWEIISKMFENVKHNVCIFLSGNKKPAEAGSKKRQGFTEKQTKYSFEECRKTPYISFNLGSDIEISNDKLPAH